MSSHITARSCFYKRCTSSQPAVCMFITLLTFNYKNDSCHMNRILPSSGSWHNRVQISHAGRVACKGAWLFCSEEWPALFRSSCFHCAALSAHHTVPPFINHGGLRVIYFLMYWEFEVNGWFSVTAKTINQLNWQINGFEWQPSYFLFSVYEDERNKSMHTKYFSKGIQLDWVDASVRNLEKVRKDSTPINDLTWRVEKDYRFVNVGKGEVTNTIKQ